MMEGRESVHCGVVTAQLRVTLREALEPLPTMLRVPVLLPALLHAATETEMGLEVAPALR